MNINVTTSTDEGLTTIDLQIDDGDELFIFGLSVDAATALMEQLAFAVQDARTTAILGGSR